MVLPQSRGARTAPVCDSICKSDRIHKKPHDRISPNFSCTLHVAVARTLCPPLSALSLVLPVLWITSCSARNGLFGASRVFEIKLILLSDKYQQVYIVRCTAGTISAIYVYLARPVRHLAADRLWKSASDGVMLKVHCFDLLWICFVTNWATNP